jgi:hypothetical protein
MKMVRVSFEGLVGMVKFTKLNNPRRLDITVPKGHIVRMATTWLVMIW